MGNASSPESHSEPVSAIVSSRWLIGAALAILIVVAAGGAVLWYRSGPQSKVDSPLTTDVDLEDSPMPDHGYVGLAACANCHPARAAEFRQTKHFRACRVPEPDRMPPGFSSGRGGYIESQQHARYDMLRKGNDFFETAIRSTRQGEKSAEARIDLVYGGGGADEVYFNWRDGGIYELPLAWLYPLDCWGAEPEVRYGQDEFAKPTTPRCLECHNTWMWHVPGTVNQYRHEGCILGITCEKCHGPGREHVAFHRTHPQAEEAHNIVHPGHLTRERQLDVCTQCHSNASRRKGPAFRYRPGEPLEEYFRIALCKQPEDDHVANQIKYLRQSKCFQKNDSLTCTTCHNPHRSTSAASPGSSARTMQLGGAQACLKCHEAADCREQPHLPPAVQGDCIGCHMPRHYKINVWFDTEKDHFVPPIRRWQHRIAIYPEARREVLLGWYRTQTDPHSRQETDRLTRELVAHWLDEAERCRREYRFLQAIAAAREALRFDTRPAVAAKLQEAIANKTRLDEDLAAALRLFHSQQITDAIQAFQKVLADKPDMATALSKLGTLYAMMGQRELATKHLQQVARCDPDDAQGYSMLGWLAFRDGKAVEAVEAYQKADSIEPYNAQINYQLGLSLSRLGRMPEATRCFREVVAIDPRHAGGCQALSDALRQQGDIAESIRYGKRAAALTHGENADVLVTLAAAYADAGKAAEAEKTVEKALDVARKSDPKLVALLQRRIDEIRKRAVQTPK
jgi:tetratricopeptide (TPR) repeat protein